MSEDNEKKVRPRHYRSLFFPVLLVALGVVFLLENINALSGDAWDTIWKLWPLILVVMGLDGLLRRDGVAGPAFFVGLGVVFLLSNFNMLAWDMWDLILRLWPVMLIAWGLDLVVGRRSILGAAVALVLVVAVLAGALLLVGVGSSTSTEAISWDPDAKITSLRADLEPAIGSLSVQAASEPTPVVQGTLRLWQMKNIRKQMDVEDGVGVFSLTTQGVTVYYPTMPNSGPRWDLSFSSELPLDLRAHLGVGEITADLRELKLTNLRLEIGLGRIKVYLPAQSFSARIEGGIGQMTLIIPTETSVNIKTDTGITGVSIPPEFDHREDFYSLDNGKDAPKIDLDLNQAIGSLVILFDR